MSRVASNPRALRLVSKWRRVLRSRYLHLWRPPNPPSPLASSLKPEVTMVTQGLGFTAVYSPSNPSLWLLGEHPSISINEERGDSPERVQLPEGRLVKQVAAGRKHVVVMTTTGEVFTMGLNSFGQCGIPPPSPPDHLLPSLQPVHHLPGQIAKVCCGLDHTHFLSTEGRLFSCGWSDDGQTGTGCYGSVATPTEVSGDITTERVRDVHCRADTSLALTETGVLFAWGNNEYRQLGIPSNELQVNTPQKVLLALPQSQAQVGGDGSVVAVATGSSFSAVLTQRGTVYYTGRLGGREEEEEEEEGAWRLLYGGEQEGEEGGRVVEIKAGLHYLAALEAGNRRILLWGRHNGNRGTAPSATPTELELTSSPLDWDAGPLDLCLLLT